MQLGREGRVVNIHPRPEAGDRSPPIFAIHQEQLLRSAEVKSEQDYRVRECLHRAGGAAGGLYPGGTYVKHLQRLPSDAALRVAARVTPFFWADAAHIRVWLCRDCADELGLSGRESDAA
jgi:hypothetical protein